ncbi:MAG TPA: DUF6252 family protein [Chitinophagaceae bacterium]|nr:hypothetical protein [Chitinophagaceae bacterium]MCB9054844.1 hypothetical protein [Chitinophagales bacterium]HPG10126.1 DUF6252 family protein [Chitinophagaceae bacterium]HRX92634.1 DUF6252 family protein [Chitinophagaceae bacterium]
MKKLLVILIAFLAFAACKKKITELPAVTQTGANTFGAKVNGSLWVPQGFGPIPANDILEARMIGRDIIINARNFASSPNETEFELRINDVNAPGTYLLNTDVVHPANNVSYAYYVKRNITPDNEWLTSSASTGSVTISKVDTVNWIVSGTFQFDMLNIYNAPQPLSVTEGRFDIKVQ